MYQQHELSKKFPSMGVDAFQELVSDIRINGLRHNIILYEGKILDGWHRYRACLAASVQPRIVDYKGSSPAALVISENIHRRDLTGGQRALIVVECNDWAPGGRPKTPPNGEVSAKSIEQMAAQADTSNRTIERAKVVSAKGSEALKEAVRSAEVTIAKAADVAQTTPKKQQAKSVKEKTAPKPKPPKPETIPKADYDKLVTQLNALAEKNDFLEFSLKANVVVIDKDQVDQLRDLMVENKGIRKARDEAMAKIAELERQSKWWRKEAEKLGWKPKK